MIEEEAKKSPAKKPEVKPDSYEVAPPENIDHTEGDYLHHGMKMNKSFREKYGSRWRDIANALVKVHTWHLRTNRQR